LRRRRKISAKIRIILQISKRFTENLLFGVAPTAKANRQRSRSVGKFLAQKIVV